MSQFLFQSSEVKYLKPMGQGGKRTVCPTWIAPLGVV